MMKYMGNNEKNKEKQEKLDFGKVSLGCTLYNVSMEELHIFVNPSISMF